MTTLDPKLTVINLTEEKLDPAIFAALAKGINFVTNTQSIPAKELLLLCRTHDTWFCGGGFSVSEKIHREACRAICKAYSLATISSNDSLHALLVTIFHIVSP